MCATCFVCNDAAKGLPAGGWKTARVRVLGERGRRIVHRDRAEGIALGQQRLPNFASQMRDAFSSMASNTGSSSPGELADHLKHVGGGGLLLRAIRAAR